MLRDFPTEIRNSNGFSGRKQVISKKKTSLHWNSEGFSGRNQIFKRFFRPKTGDLQKQNKKKVFNPKNIMKSGVSPQKLRKYRRQTPIWASICTSVAPSPLLSSGNSPRLGGHNFRLGWARPRNAPPWRRACLIPSGFRHSCIQGCEVILINIFLELPITNIFFRATENTKHDVSGLNYVRNLSALKRCCSKTVLLKK